MKQVYLALNLLMVENSLQAVDFSQSSDNLCDIYCYCVCIVWLLICLFFCLWQELLIRKCFVILLTFVAEHEYSVLLKLVLMVRLYSANAQKARFLGCLWAMLGHTLSEIMQMSISQWRTCCPHRRMPVCVPTTVGSFSLVLKCTWCWSIPMDVGNECISLNYYFPTQW